MDNSLIYESRINWILKNTGLIFSKIVVVSYNIMPSVSRNFHPLLVLSSYTLSDWHFRFSSDKGLGNAP
jgi:hypothetical protein